MANGFNLDCPENRLIKLFKDSVENTVQILHKRVRVLKLKNTHKSAKGKLLGIIQQVQHVDLMIFKCFDDIEGVGVDGAPPVRVDPSLVRINQSLVESDDVAYQVTHSIHYTVTYICTNAKTEALEGCSECTEAKISCHRGCEKIPVRRLLSWYHWRIGELSQQLIETLSIWCGFGRLPPR